jgi:hypothetical protein
MIAEDPKAADMEIVAEFNRRLFEPAPTLKCIQRDRTKPEMKMFIVVAGDR